MDVNEREILSKLTPAWFHPVDNRKQCYHSWFLVLSVQ